MRRLPGVLYVHRGIDRAAGTVAAVSVWDSEEHARFSHQAGDRAAVQRQRPLPSLGRRTHRVAAWLDWLLVLRFAVEGNGRG